MPDPAARLRDALPTVFSTGAIVAVVVSVVIAVFVGFDARTAPIIRVTFFGLVPCLAVLTAAAIAIARGRRPGELAAPCLLALLGIMISVGVQTAWDAEMRAEGTGLGPWWWASVAAGAVVVAMSIFSLVWLGVRADRRRLGVLIVFALCSIVGGAVLMVLLAIWATPFALAIAAVGAAAVSRRASRPPRRRTETSAPF